MAGTHRVKRHYTHARSGKRVLVSSYTAKNPYPYAVSESEYHRLFGEHPLAGKNVSEIRVFESRRARIEHARAKRRGYSRAYGRRR